MQLYPTFRYTDNFGEFGAVPEFRVNKPRLGNTHPTATVSLCTLGTLGTFHSFSMGTVMQRRGVLFQNH
jgi:hypothetical protein